MVNKYLEKAERLLQKGKMDGALEQYLLAWKEEPANDAIVQTVAELYQTLNKPKESRDCYSYLFDKCVERGEASKAMEVLRKLQRMGPVEPKRLVACAQLLEAQKADAAAEFYRQGLELAGEEDKALALQCLQGLAKLSPRSLPVYERLAKTALRCDQPSVAASAYQKVGELLSAGGKWPEAVEALEQSHRLSGKSASGALPLARACLKAGRFSQVVELLDAHSQDPETMGLLAEAYLAQKQLEKAQALYWKLLAGYPQALDPLFEIAKEYLSRGAIPQALELFKGLEQHLSGGRAQRELIAFAEKLGHLKVGSIPLLEYSTRLFDRLHLDSPLAAALHTLFDLYFAAGDFPQATDTLERLIDVDMYAPECGDKLQRLEGKAEPGLWRELAGRLGKTSSAADGFSDTATDSGNSDGADSETPSDGENALQDLMLQVEIFLQYRMEDKARERLKRIAKLFPREEEKNEELRSLFAKAKLTPSSASAPKTPAVAAPAPAADIRADLSRISEISRNLSRQGNVKGVLSSAVNDIGQLWQVSRCVAGLVTPNRPPSMVLEYIAPGTPPSDGALLGKLVTGLQQLVVGQGRAIVAEAVSEMPQLVSLKVPLTTLQVESLAAIPLQDGVKHVGILVLEQCGSPRAWKGNDLAGLEALAEQIVMGVANARLRNLMRTLAVTDEGSGLLHRDSYLTCLLSEAERTRVQKLPLTVTLFRFLQPDPRPPEGWSQTLERFLKEFSATLTSHLRQNDIAVKYDSDSLALILPGTSGKDAAVVAEKLRKLALAAAQSDSGANPRVPVGIAEAIREGGMDNTDVITELVNRVEGALETAQQGAGNATQLLEPPGRAG